MNEALILYTAIFVFSMMLIGLALTMLEFKALRQRKARGDVRTFWTEIKNYINDVTTPEPNYSDLQPIRVQEDVRNKKY